MSDNNVLELVNLAANFYFDLDEFFEDIDLDKCNFSDDFIADYVNRLFRQNGDLLVGDDRSPYKEYDGIWQEVMGYLNNKDIAGIEKVIYEQTGEDIHDEFMGKYGNYDELTDNQKEFVDKYLNEYTIYVIDDFSQVYGDGKRYRDGEFAVICPYIDTVDKELTEWCFDNDVMTINFVYTLSSDPARLEDFVFYYYKAIQYAINYIE